VRFFAVEIDHCNVLQTIEFLLARIVAERWIMGRSKWLKKEGPL
jgi:hypothetical protein